MPKTFGIGIGHFSIDSLDLSFPPSFPPLPLNNVAAIWTDSDNADFKVYAWPLPFLNVFGMNGKLDGRTPIDFRGIGVPLHPRCRCWKSTTAVTHSAAESCSLQAVMHGLHR